MNTKWESKKIKDIAIKVGIGPFGSSIKVSTFKPSGVPVISGQHLHKDRLDDEQGFNFISIEHAKSLSNALVYRGDVVFTHAGNIGQVAYIPQNSQYDCYILSQRQFYMRCNLDIVLPEFVTYYFKTSEGRHKLLANTSSSGVPSIARPVSNLREIEIPIPELDEQIRIINQLCVLDDKIELNRRMNKTLEEIAQALFKHWFIDFEFPNEEGKPYKSSGGEMVDSELGPIPKGWYFGSIGDLCFNPQYGFTASATSENTGVKFLRITDINKTPWICWSDVPYCDISMNDFEKYRLLKGDILIARMADPGQSTYIERDVNSVFASYLIRFRPRRQKFGRFLQYWLRSDKFWSQAHGSSSGTTRKSLNAQVLSGFHVLTPHISVMDSFRDIIDSYRYQVDFNSNNLILLIRIRAKLLRTMFGKESND